ncbi:MAG: tetratricopeptide repeat protein [Desulfatibacillaceae bacterium]
MTTYWACVLAALAAVLIFMDGWILGPEAQQFVLNHLEDRPVAEIVLDPATNDHGLYQGRELSYLFDHLDVRAIEAAAAANHAHFYSLVHLACLVLIAWANRFFLLRYVPGLPGRANLLFMLLFVSSVPVAFNATFYRSSKILVALSVMLVLCLAARAMAREDVRQRTNFLVFLAATLPLPLLDRQGVFLLLLFLALLAGRRILGGRYRPWHFGFLAASSASLALGALYNHVAGPWLIHAVHGYWPDFTFQALPWHVWFADWSAFLARGTVAFFDGISALFGNPGTWFGILAWLAGLGAVIRYFGRRRDSSMAPWPWLYVGASAAFVVADSVMFLRLREFMSDEWMETRYYWLPFLVCVLVAGQALAAPLLGRSRRGRVVGAVLLAFLLVGNALALHRYKTGMLEDSGVGRFHEVTRALARCASESAPGVFTYDLAIDPDYVGDDPFLSWLNPRPSMVCSALRPPSAPSLAPAVRKFRRDMARSCPDFRTAGAFFWKEGDGAPGFLRGADMARIRFFAAAVEEHGGRYQGEEDPAFVDMAPRVARLYNLFRELAVNAGPGEVAGLYMVNRPPRDRDRPVLVVAMGSTDAIDAFVAALPESAGERAVVQKPREPTRHPLAQATLGATGFLASEGFCLEPDMYERLFALGIELYRADLVSEAAEALSATLAFSESVSAAHAMLGGMYMELGDHARAARHFERAMELSPEDVRPKNNLAWLLATTPAPEVAAPVRAVRLATEALADAEAKVDTLDTLAAAYARQGDYARAEQLAEHAAALAREAGNNRLAAEIGERLAAYRDGRPWLEHGAAE